MAGIDKIYCTCYKDFKEFYNWCEMINPLFQKETQLSLLDYFYYTKDEIIEYFGKCGHIYWGFPITNFPEHVDIWLIRHCPIKFVRNRLLNEQYKYLKIKNKDINLYLNYGRTINRF